MLKFTSILSTIFLLFVGIIAQAQTSCPATYIVSTEVDSTKITVKWASQSTTANANTTYTLEYALAPATASSTWTAATTTPNKTFTIPNLTKCTYYSVRVKTNCSATAASPWSLLTSVKTKGCVPCPKPSFTSTTEIDSNSLVVYWQRGTSSAFQVQYTASPVTASSVWITGNGSMLPSPHYQATGLQKCKEYTFRVRANCSPLVGTTPTYSDWSEYKSLKTKGCVVVLPCLAPATINAISDSNKIVLSWLPSAITGATYTIEYTAAPFSATSVWTTATSTTPTFTIGNLSKCKEYAYRVKTNCSATSSSGWSSYKITKTTGCVVVLPCLKPVYTAIADSNKVTLSWATPNNNYQIEYTAVAVAGTTVTPTWIPVPVTVTPTIISGLTKCTYYAVRVRTACANNKFSEWENKNIKTTGCAIIVPCQKTEIKNYSADSTKITFSWGAIAGSTYQVQYAAAPITTTTTWISVTTTSNPATITGLSKCKEYVIRVRTACANNTFSDWSSKTIKTTGCTVVLPCLKPIYAVIADSNKVTLSWASPNNNYQIEYVTVPSSVTTVTPTWVSVPSPLSNPTIITGLSKCTYYSVRMRTVCANGKFSDWETRNFKTSGCVQKNCPKPTIFSFVEDSTKVSLTALPGIAFNIYYTAAPALATSTWVNTTTTNNPLTITGLTKCKEYVMRIRNVCASDYFSEWETKTFKTKGCPAPAPCIKPALLTSTPITGGVTLNWTGTSQCYQVRYAKKTTATAVWKTDSVCTKSHTIIDLDACTFYAWQVRSRCSDGVWGEWTSKATFETGGCSERKAKVMTLSPNPGTYLNVAYYLRQAGNVSVEITNLQGVSVGKYELGKQESGANSYSLDNLNFAAGAYLVFIKVNGVKLEVQRWIKNVD
jgi:hypothetical protein